MILILSLLSQISLSFSSPSFIHDNNLNRSAGILYEIWHCQAAQAMAQVKDSGSPQLTVETVIQSQETFTLDDVYPASKGPYPSEDIWNVQPLELGFYCLCAKRSLNDSDLIPECPMRAQVAKRHAELLVSGGFDYIAVDVTNWPQVNPATEVAILNPLENLFDLWLDLRANNIPTPQIVVWVDSPVAAYPDGSQTTWSCLDNPNKALG